MAESDSVKRANKAPISSHPAFPAIVALWFAALLGLGSMVLPIALFERLATISGIGAFVPAAEPPLGFTARAVIALAGAFGGAAIGLLLARQVARSHAPKPRSAARTEAHECRPISAHDELGDVGLGPFESVSTGRKRRLLTVSESPETGSPAAEVHDGEDFPAEGDWRTDEVGLHGSVPQTTTAPEDELGDSAKETAVVPEAGAQAGLEAPGRREELAEADLSTQDQTIAEAQRFRAGRRDQADEAEVSEAGVRFIETPAPQLPAADPSDAAQGSHLPLDDRPLEELGLVQLAGRLGAAIENRRMRKVTRSAAAPAVASDAAPDASADFGVAEPEDAARAIASFFGPGEAAAPPLQTPEEFAAEPRFSEVPASMRTLQVHEDDEYGEEDDAFVGSFSLPLSAPANGHHLTAGEPVDEEDNPGADDTEEGEYSSLLAMKNPFSRHEEFVRVEEPEMEAGDFEPTVTFPAAGLATRLEAPADARPEQDVASPAELAGPSEKPTDSADFAATPGTRRDPAAADRDLRAALATLQRMNGAA